MEAKTPKSDRVKSTSKSLTGAIERLDSNPSITCSKDMDTKEVNQFDYWQDSHRN